MTFWPPGGRFPHVDAVPQGAAARGTAKCPLDPSQASRIPWNQSSALLVEIHYDANILGRPPGGRPLVGTVVRKIALKAFGYFASLAITLGICPGVHFASFHTHSNAVFADDSTPDNSASKTDEGPLDPRLQRVFAGGAPESVADLRAMQEHVLRLTERLQKSTVGVRVGPAHGSGVIVKDGYVLTAGHVVGLPKRDASFVLYDGRMVRGRTLGMNAEIDSGMMRLNDPGDLPAVELGDSSTLKKGQWVLALGHPGGYETGRRPVLRMGRILDIEDDLIRTDCTLVGGDSGGPLFDMQGRVIAIHSRIGQYLTANIHVPVNAYKESWDRLAAGEAWGVPLASNGPYIGVGADPDSREARVAEVHEDSPAAKAGIKVGDVIVKFGGQDIADFPALARQVQAQRPGDKVQVEVRRQMDGAEKTVELELEIGRREEE
jgi:serine protease Do